MEGVKRAPVATEDFNRYTASFSQAGISMELLVKLPDVTGSRTFKIATSKLEIRLSQLVALNCT